MQHRDRVILQKILSEIDLLLSFVENFTREDFLSDEKTKRAVGMTAINVGELVKNLSQDFREENSNIAWKAAARFRDIVAHKYETLDMSDVFDTLIEDFPELKVQIEKILSQEVKK